MAASMRRPGSYDDTFGMLGLSSTSLEMVKCTITLPNIQSQLQGGQAQQTATVELNAAINMLAPVTHKVSQMLPHPSLPLVALVFGDLNLIKVY